MEARISMITLGVDDIKKSTEFYQNGLGLPLSKNSNPHISFFELNGAWLALFAKDALAKDANVPAHSEGFPGVTIAHNVRNKEEVDSVLTIAQKAGARINKPAADTFWGGYSGYFSDPDGHLWEVAWNPHFSI